MSVSRRLAASRRSSARAQASRELDSASSEIFASRSVSAIRFSADASASAATRRALSADSISLISARRFSANIAGALSSSARSAVTSVTRASMVAMCEAALGLTVLPFVAFGQNRLQPAVGQFRLARQRLRLGADLRGKAAVAFDVAAHGGEPGFGLKTRRQFLQRGDRIFMRGLGLGAVGIEAGMRFGQRRFSRGVAVDFALGRGMAFARGIGLALGVAPGFARGALRRMKPPSSAVSANSSA